MTTRNITITAICTSIIAMSGAYFNIRSSCQQESKVIARLTKLYQKACVKSDKKCLRRAKRMANSERSKLCKIVL